MALIRIIFSFRTLVWTWTSAVDIVVVTHAKQNTYARNIRTGPFSDSKFKWAGY